MRVFIVATKPELPHYTFPKPTHSKDALLRDQASGAYWEAHGRRKPKHVPDPPSTDDASLAWSTVRDALKELPTPASSEDEARMNHWSIPGARAYVGHAGSRLDWPAKTIKAGVHGVPGGENILIEDDGGIRYFTLRETARIQTFPNNHVFEGARLHITRQIGNAVPCDLATAIARPLHKLLAKRSKDYR
jgi:DNA (cytosine-5)-methyltransferase 1